MNGNRTLGYSMLAPALIVIGVFILYPIVGAFVTSFFADTPFAPRRFVGLGNFARLTGDDPAIGSVGFTLLFVAVSTTLEILLGLLMALVMHHTWRGRGWIRAAVLIPWAIPTVVTAVMWKFMFNDQYGFFNLLWHGNAIEYYTAWLADPGSARLAIIMADVWKTSSFAALIILAGLQTIPRELYDAARVDGAGAFRRFRAITLPLLRPAIVLALLFRVIDAFRVFDLVYVMTQGAPGNSTSVLQFYGYQKMFPEQQFGYGSAISVVVFLMIAVFGWIAVRMLSTRMHES
ncbi:MAG TPA: sugar ABC transporter permease [Acidobacteriota bacterium]|nr:sugar ABC transporter permease [Acidobacteriota bacterium]